MSETGEKRGPVEKTDKGWPINPIGAFALTVFVLIGIFFILKPFLESRNQPIDQNQNANAQGGSITSPQSGEVIKTNSSNLQITIDEPQKVDKVQYWVKTYSDGKWNMIGEVNSAPYNLTWQIPSIYQNKALALTAHIYQKDGNVIKDPGGWREGIIILSQ